MRTHKRTCTKFKLESAGNTVVMLTEEEVGASFQSFPFSLNLFSLASTVLQIAAHMHILTKDIYLSFSLTLLYNDKIPTVLCNISQCPRMQAAEDHKEEQVLFLGQEGILNISLDILTTDLFGNSAAESRLVA